jgi:AraC-like DNA-binding protein
MSQPTLYRKIKERSELSIIKVIRSIRMSKAASLIMEHKYSVLEISEMVGFNDPNTFRKHFIEQFGVLPSKYDERSKGGEIDEQQRRYIYYINRKCSFRIVWNEHFSYFILL